MVPARRGSVTCCGETKVGALLSVRRDTKGS